MGQSFRFLTTCVLVLAGFSCGGRAQTELPVGSLLLGDQPLARFALRLDGAEGNARAEQRSVQGPGFSAAWRIETLRDTSPAAAIELRALTTQAVRAGDVALLRFFARAAHASDETGVARMMIVIRKNGVDWNSSYEGDFSFGREWQEILVPFVWAKDFEPEGAAVMLRFGFKAQTVELGGLELVGYGQTRTYASLPRTQLTYAGREANARWRQEALDRIERFRKSDVVINVVDAAGQPAPNAKVRLTQTRSAFQWGTALQMERLVVDTPDNRRYREITLQLFNAASTENDLKWPVWLGEWEGNYSRAQTLAGLRWLRAHAFHIRGHVLVWPGRKNLPNGAQALLGNTGDDAIPKQIEAHIREITRATRGLVDEWDVLNEPFTNHDVMDRFGPEVMPPWFKVAREELPDTPLYFNDFSNHDATTDADHVAHFERTTRFLLEHGAPVGGLGLQAHFGGRPNAPENILAALDRYQAQFQLPIRITEFDVWTHDEELQADFTRDFLILCFSHPAVIGVQHWGFWETCHWRPPAAMYRSDWSEKPNARVYQDLVLRTWRTREEGTTDAQGRLRTRGFHGDYTVRVEADGRQIEMKLRLPAQPEPATWNIVLP